MPLPPLDLRTALRVSPLSRRQQSSSVGVSENHSDGNSDLDLDYRYLSCLTAPPRPSKVGDAAVATPGVGGHDEGGQGPAHGDHHGVKVGGFAGRILSRACHDGTAMDTGKGGNGVTAG